ncbi:hypothetical protein [Streptomyces sp. SGAir0957]
MIAATSAVTLGTCEADPATRGCRVLEVETLGPLHRVVLDAELKDGTTTVLAVGDQAIVRHRVVSEYDAARPTDGTASVSDKVTKRTEGGQPRNWPTLMADARVTQTVCDWVVGGATSTLQDPGGLAITEKATYDAAGRQISRGLPASSGSDAGTLITDFRPPQARPERGTPVSAWQDVHSQAGALGGPHTRPVRVRGRCAVRSQGRPAPAAGHKKALAGRGRPARAV